MPAWSCQANLLVRKMWRDRSSAAAEKARNETTKLNIQANRQYRELQAATVHDFQPHPCSSFSSPVHVVILVVMITVAVFALFRQYSMRCQIADHILIASSSSQFGAAGSAVDAVCS